MQSSELSAASVLITIATASPANYEPLDKRGQAFQVHQSVRKPYILSDPATMAKPYAKCAKIGAVAPSYVLAAAANFDGTVTANPEEEDSEYLCPVTVGG
jgi:hypothetical protein